MNTKKIRKAFTLVELLVVIAILAILGTVGVVGYTAFVNKARVSNDKTLCTQLNTILQAEEISDKPDTIAEAVTALKENGYIVANLNPTAEGYYFVWNKEENRMMYVNKNLKVEYPEDLINDTVDENWYIPVSTLEDKETLSTLLGTGTKATIVYASESYSDLKKNVNNDLQTNGGDLMLANDISVSVDENNASVLTINCGDKKADLDLAGSTIKSEGTNAWGGDRAINVNSGKVTIENGTIDAYGTESDSGAYGAIKITGGEVAVKNMTLNNYRPNGMNIKVMGGDLKVSDTIINCKNGGGIEAGGNTSVTPNTKCTVSVKDTIINQTGNKGNGGGACAASCLAACYDGTLTVESGTFSTANYCVYVFSSGGTINLNGGSYKSTSSEVLIKNIISSDAIANGIVNISGGNFNTKDNNCKMFEVGDASANHSVSINITGGTFNGKAFSEMTEKDDWTSLCADGCKVTGWGTNKVVITTNA